MYDLGYYLMRCPLYIIAKSIKDMLTPYISVVVDVCMKIRGIMKVSSINIEITFWYICNENSGQASLQDIACM